MSETQPAVTHVVSIPPSVLITLVMFAASQALALVSLYVKWARWSERIEGKMNTVTDVIIEDLRRRIAKLEEQE